MNFADLKIFCTIVMIVQATRVSGQLRFPMREEQSDQSFGFSRLSTKTRRSIINSECHFCMPE